MGRAAAPSSSLNGAHVLCSYGDCSSPCRPSAPRLPLGLLSSLQVMTDQAAGTLILAFAPWPVRVTGKHRGALLAGVVADLLGIYWASGIVGDLTLCCGILTALIMRETAEKRLKRGIRDQYQARSYIWSICHSTAGAQILHRGLGLHTRKPHA